MTVYADDMNLTADVPNGDHVVRGQWSHLYADTEEELRAFAKQLGLRDSWIQHPGEIGVHFDVTSPVRQRAIRQGARPVTWREAEQHVAQQRQAQRAQRAQEAPRAEEHEERPAEAQRPAEGRQRHAWGETTTDDGRKVCFRKGCGMEAEQRWNPATGRPLVIYSKDGQRLVSERVPPCGSELPGGEISTEEWKPPGRGGRPPGGRGVQSGGSRSCLPAADRCPLPGSRTVTDLGRAGKAAEGEGKSAPARGRTARAGKVTGRLRGNRSRNAEVGGVECRAA